MSKNICRICLKAVCYNFQIKALDNTSYELLLKLNLDINKDSVMCNECLEKLLVPLHLISTCSYIEKFDSINNANAVVETRDQWKCCFCTKITERDGLVSLNDSKENMFLLDMLKEHFPELNLSNTELLLTCETCLDSLGGLLSFIKNRLNMEEKIRTYIEIEETTSKDQVELNNAQEFTLKPILKFESEFCDVNDKRQCYNEIREEFKIKVETEIKTEEMVNHELHINPEEIDIKLDQSDYEIFQENFTSNLMNDSKIHAHQCSICSFSTDCENDLGRHILTHKTSLQKKYKCGMCTYGTNLYSHLHEHMLSHKSCSEISWYKCEICSSETKRKKQVKITIFKCARCSYASKYKSHLKQHMLVHQNSSEVTMYKCEKCTYETKQKQCLKRHMLIHKSPSQINMYKCEICSYETKHQRYINHHMLTHKNPSEITMFKCAKCAYESKYKQRIKMHMLVHQNRSEMTMYGCVKCTFETKTKRHLNSHMLVHKDPSEVNMYKCEICSYITKYRGSIKRHMLIHKNPSEINMYKCEICSFETKRQGSINRHMLTHKSPSEEVQM